MLNYRRCNIERLFLLVQVTYPFSLLGTLSQNYCSKFVWQAFYYGEGIDLTNVNNTPDLRGFVTPSMVINSPF